MFGRLQQGLARGERALARFDRRKGRPLTVAPDFYDLDFEPVELLTDDKVTLSGWFLPAARYRPTDPMVLLHHHYGGQKAALLPWLELLQRLGVPALCFDARDHAGSPCPPGRGSYVARFADVRAAANELLRRGARRIVAYGQSQGGAVVVGGLAHRPELVGVILDSGPSASALLSLWGLARGLPEQEQALVGSAAVFAELYRRMRPASYPLHLWRGLYRLRQRRLLWLHGTEDRIIPAAWARPWFEALRPAGPGWRRMSVAGAQHAECLQTGGPAVAQAVGDLLGVG